MNYDVVIEKITDVLIECQVHSFPLNCFDLLSHYGYRVFSYRELEEKNHEIYEMCISYSEDAFHNGSGRIVAYNERRPSGRIRFSLMHELGHILLKHRGNGIIFEREANFFASHILAPRIAMHYASCLNCQETANRFGLTLEAADYAFQDYRCWRRTAIYKMSMADKKLYQHFYDSETDCFVYHRVQCSYCGQKIVNSASYICHDCDKTMFHKIPHPNTLSPHQISDCRLFGYLENGR